MNKGKPNLYDPEEWKIVRQMYFNPVDFTKFKIEDQLEKLDRQQRKQKQKIKQSR